MNLFYKAKVVDYPKPIHEGVAVGDNIGQITQKIVDYYGNSQVEELTLWFGEFDEEDVIELDDFYDCPLFDFKKKS